MTDGPNIRVGIDGSAAKTGAAEVRHSLAGIRADAAKVGQDFAEASKVAVNSLNSIKDKGGSAIKDAARQQINEMNRAKATIVAAARSQASEMVSIAQRERDQVIAAAKGKGTAEVAAARQAANAKLAEARRASAEYVALIRAETAAVVAEAKRQGDMVAREAAAQAKRQQQASAIQLRSGVMTGNLTTQQNNAAARDVERQAKADAAAYNRAWSQAIAEDKRRDRFASSQDKSDASQAAMISGLRASAQAISAASPAAARYAAEMAKLAAAHRAGAITSKEFAAAQSVVKQRLAESTTAVDKHVASQQKFMAGQSSLQRFLLNTSVALRGMAAAFGFREILEANLNLQRFENTLKAASGSQSAYVENLEFLKKTAQDVGINVGSVGNSFSRFTLAAKAAGFSTDEVHKAFEQLTGASRNFGLSADDTTGVIRALEQSLSKGKFMAEEVRLQLGDRLPIAMQALQKATGASGAELNKMFEQGSISTEKFFVPFVKQLFELSGGQKALAVSSQSLSADLGRLGTAFLFAAGEGGASGFNAAVGDAAKALAGFLEGSRGQGAFRAVGATIKFIADNFGLLTTAAAGFVGLKIVSAFSQVIGVGGTASKVILDVATATRTFGVAATAGAVATRGWSAALAAFGGPVGLAVTAVIVGLTAAMTGLFDTTDKGEQATSDYEKAMRLAGDAIGFIPEQAKKAADEVDRLNNSMASAREATRNSTISSTAAASDILGQQNDSLAGFRRDRSIKQASNFIDSGSLVSPGMTALVELAKQYEGVVLKTSGDTDALIRKLQNIRTAAEEAGEDGVSQMATSIISSLDAGMAKLRELEGQLVNNKKAEEEMARSANRAAQAVAMRQKIQAQHESDASFGEEFSGSLLARQAIDKQMAPEQSDAQAYFDALKKSGTEAAKEVEAAQKRVAEATKIAEKAFKDYQESINITGKSQMDLNEALKSSDPAMKAAAEQAKKNAQAAVDLNAATDKAIKIEELAAKIRDESRGGLDTLAKKIKEVYEAYGAGRITQEEFNGALNDIRTDGIDAYKEAVRQGQTELANFIKAQLLADAAAQDAANNMARSAVSVLNSVQTALGGVILAGQQAGGIMASVANAAKAGLSFVTGFFGGGTGGGNTPPATTPGMNNFDEQWKKYLSSLKHKGGGGAAATTTKFEDQVKDLQKTLDAQNKLNEAYEQGSFAVAKANEELEIQNKLNEISTKYSKDRVAEVEKLIRANAAAKNEEEALKEIQSQKDSNALLEAELGLVGATKEVREKELAILQAKQNLLQKGIDPTGDVGARAIDEISKGVDLQQEVDRQERASEDISDMWTSAFDNVGSAITEAFTQGKGSVIDFGSIAMGVVSELAQSVIKLGLLNPVKNWLLGTSETTLFGNSGSANGGGTGVGGMGGGGLGGNFNLGGISKWLFGTAGSTPASGIGPIMPSTSGVLGSGGQFLGMNGSSFLGGAGSVISSILPGLMSGNGMQSAFGGGGALIGSIAGSFVPVIGTAMGGMLGGMLGNMLGGLFGGQKKVPFSASAVQYDDGRFKANSAYGKGGQGVEGVRSLTDTATQALNDLLKKLDLAVTGNLGALSDDRTLNNRKNNEPDGFTGFTVKEDKIKAYVAGDKMYEGSDQQEAASAFIGGMIKRMAAAGNLAGDEIMVQVLKGLKDTSTEAIDAAINFAGVYKSFVEIKDPLTDIEQKVQDLKDTAKDLTEQAADYGIGAEKINEALAKQIDLLKTAVNDNLDRGISGFSDPVGLGWNDLIKAQADAMKDVLATGGDVAKLQKLNYLQQLDYLVKLTDAQRKLFAETASAAEKAILDVANAYVDVTDILNTKINETTQALEKWADVPKMMQDAIDSLKISDQSTLSTPDKLAEAQGQFDELVKKALSGDADAAAQLPGAGQNLLTIGDQMYGSTGQYSQIFDNVTKALAQVGDFGKNQATAAEGQLAEMQKQVDLLGQIRDLLATGANASSVNGLLDALRGTGFDVEGSGLKTALDKLGGTQLTQQKAQTEATRSSLQGQIGTVSAQIAQTPTHSQGDLDRISGLSNSAGGVAGLGGQTVGFSLGTRDPGKAAEFVRDFNATLKALGLPGGISNGNVNANPLKEQFEANVAGRKFTGKTARDLFVPMMQAMQDAGQFGSVWGPLADAIRQSSDMGGLVSKLQGTIGSWQGDAAKKADLQAQLANLQAQLNSLPKFAKGGVVPNTAGGIDNVLLRATPGEGILSHAGMSALARLNSGGSVGDNGEIVQAINDNTVAVKDGMKQQIAGLSQMVRVLSDKLERIEEEQRRSRTEAQFQGQGRRVAS